MNFWHYFDLTYWLDLLLERNLFPVICGSKLARATHASTTNRYENYPILTAILLR